MTRVMLGLDAFGRNFTAPHRHCPVIRERYYGTQSIALSSVVSLGATLPT